MVNRILSFGCSHTFGHGLEDCFVAPNYPGNIPSRHASQSLLADNLNLNLENLSQPGSSAKQIAHRVLNSFVHKTDLVIIMWPHYHRTCVFDNKDTVKKIGPWMSEFENYYTNYYSDYDAYFEYYSYINFIDKHLTQYTDNVVHLQFDYTDKFKFNWNTVKIEPVYFIDVRDNHPLALDNLHSGPAAHSDFAMKLLPIIEKYVVQKMRNFQ